MPVIMTVLSPMSAPRSRRSAHSVCGCSFGPATRAGPTTLKPLELIGLAWYRIALSTRDTPTTGPAPPRVTTVTSIWLFRLAWIGALIVTDACSSTHLMEAINCSRSAGLRSLYAGSDLILLKCLPSLVSPAATSAGRSCNWAGLADAWHGAQNGAMSVTAYGGP